MSLTEAEAERYARHLILREIGGAGQARLRAARVLVIGAGGIGSPVLLYLAAAGVGTLGIVDDDRVALSNLQRQIAHGTADLGRLKTESAAGAIARIDPATVVAQHALRLVPETAEDLVGAYDLVVDGSDNFATRHAVGDAAFRRRRPLVSAAVAEFELQLSTFLPHLRGPDGARLHPCYRCLVPEAPPGAQSCTEMGVVGALTGVAGTLAALEAIKLITGAGTPLAGRLFVLEALSFRARTLTLPPDPACPLCGG